MDTGPSPPPPPPPAAPTSPPPAPVKGASTVRVVRLREYPHLVRPTAQLLATQWPSQSRFSREVGLRGDIGAPRHGPPATGASPVSTTVLDADVADRDAAARLRRLLAAVDADGGGDGELAALPLPAHYVGVVSAATARDDDTAAPGVTVVAHAQLQRATDVSDVSGGCLVHSVVVDASQRRKGVGRMVMTVLERAATTMGFSMIFLSTEDREDFYTACGYTVTDAAPVVAAGAVATKLSTEARESLENSLARRLALGPRGSGAGAAGVGGTGGDGGGGGVHKVGSVWMRRRLRDFNDGYVLPRDQVAADIARGVQNVAEMDPEVLVACLTGSYDDEVRSDASVTIGSGGNTAGVRSPATPATPGAPTSGAWRIGTVARVVEMPWQRQIGPTCGLTALRMAADAVVGIAHSVADSATSTPESPSSPSARPGGSLLDAAIAAGVTAHGEVFSARDLARLAQSGCGMDAALLDFGRCAAADVRALLAEGVLLIVPYDRRLSDHSPALMGGAAAHWCVVVGYVDCDSDTSASTTGTGALTRLEHVPPASGGCLAGARVDTATRSTTPGARVSEAPHEKSERATIGQRDVLLVCQHSVSKRALVTPLSRLQASNAQLHAVKPSAAASTVIMSEGGPKLSRRAVAVARGGEARRRRDDGSRVSDDASVHRIADLVCRMAWAEMIYTDTDIDDVEAQVGCLTLGQDADDLCSDYESHQAFEGDMALWQMHKHAYTATEVATLYAGRPINNDDRFFSLSDDVTTDCDGRVRVWHDDSTSGYDMTSPQPDTTRPVFVCESGGTHVTKLNLDSALPDGDGDGICDAKDTDDDKCIYQFRSLASATDSTTVQGGDGDGVLLIVEMHEDDAPPNAAAAVGPPGATAYMANVDAKCVAPVGAGPVLISSKDAVDKCGMVLAGDQYYGSLSYGTPACPEARVFSEPLKANVGSLLIGSDDVEAVAGTPGRIVDARLHAQLKVCTLPDSGGDLADDNHDAVRKCFDGAEGPFTVVVDDTVLAALYAKDRSAAEAPGATPDTTVSCVLERVDGASAANVDVEGEKVLTVRAASAPEDDGTGMLSHGVVASPATITALPETDTDAGADTVAVMVVRLLCQYHKLEWATADACSEPAWCPVRDTPGRALRTSTNLNTESRSTYGSHDAARRTSAAAKGDYMFSDAFVACRSKEICGSDAASAAAVAGSDALAYGAAADTSGDVGGATSDKSGDPGSTTPLSRPLTVVVVAAGVLLVGAVVAGVVHMARRASAKVRQASYSRGTVETHL